MLCTHMRSSLLGSKEFCEMKTFLSYNLSFKEGGNFKADAGNALHKGLELLGLKKYIIQKKQKFVENEALSEPLHIDKLTPEKAFEIGWNHYKGLSSHLDWDDAKTIKKYKAMYYELLEFRDGAYNPLNLDIVKPEQFFEFEVKKDWAKYDYTIAGQQISGYLKLRGTVDLIFRNDYGGYSSLDWKTGKRVNWSKGEWYKPKIKEYKDLQVDKQLLLYYYSLVNMLDTHEISSIIYYLQDGGPFELYFDEDSYILAENLIRRQFEDINNIKIPQLTRNLGDAGENFYNKRKCGWCDFNKIQPKVSTEKTVCEHFRSEIVTLGMNKVLDKYATPDKFSEYVGGGRQEIEKERD